MSEVDRKKVPEIFKRHVGTWKGEYIKTDSRGHFLRSFLGTFTIAANGTGLLKRDEVSYPQVA